MLVIQHYDFDGTQGNDMAAGRRQYLHASETRTQNDLIISRSEQKENSRAQIAVSGDKPDSIQVNIRVTTATDGNHL